MTNLALRAVIRDCLPCTTFCVALADGRQLRAFLSRSLADSMRPPKLRPGDEVSVEISPYDPGVCRIVSLGPPRTD